MAPMSEFKYPQIWAQELDMLMIIVWIDSCQILDSISWADSLWQLLCQAQT